MKYNIIYHIGNELTLKTKVESATLSVQEQSLLFAGGTSFEVPFSDLIEVNMFRLNGLGRMLKLTCVNRTIYLTVVRLNVAGYFVIINFFKAGELFSRIRTQIQHAQA